MLILPEVCLLFVNIIKKDNMKTQQQADKLVQEMFSFCPIQDPIELTIINAKYCAIQAVKLILNNSKNTIPIMESSNELVCDENYWKGVLEKIEKK